MKRSKQDQFVAEGNGARSQYGALCWRMHRGKVEVLLITSRDTGRWVIPKGWPMRGKKSHAVAEREVLARLRAALPDAAFIIIAHRAPQGIGPCLTLRLADDGGADASPLAQDQELAVR